MSVPEPTSGVTLEWTLRAEVLAPTAVIARGDVARHLARRLLALNEAALARLQGVSGDGVLLVLGEEAALPWVPGVLYLGREPEAPSLLLPTTHAASMPVALLERALLARFRSLGPPLAVLPGTQQVLSAYQARPLSREFLWEWLGGDA